jgi:hypothetical protein
MSEASRPHGVPVVGITRKWGACWRGCRRERPAPFERRSPMRSAHPDFSVSCRTSCPRYGGIKGAPPGASN